MSKEISLKVALFGFGITLVLGFLALISSSFISQPANKQELRSKAAAATSLYLSPNNITVSPNQNFTLSAKIDPGSNSVSAVEVHLAFDPSKMRLNSIVKSSAFPQILGSSDLNSTINNTTGTAVFSLGIAPLHPVILVSDVAVFSFAAKSVISTAKIYFTAETKASAYNKTGNVISSLLPAAVFIAAPTPTSTPTPTPTPTPSPTPTNTPTPTPSPIPTSTPTPTPTPTPPPANLTLKIKLQNITVKRPNTFVTVNITKASGVSVLSNTYAFTADVNGIYSTTINGLPLGTFNIKLKPQTFLAKRFAGQNLISGNLTLDFTADPFLGGDTVGENNIVDIFDYNRIVSHFGPKMPAAGSPADINKDGKVDIFDYNAIVQNFNKRGAS